ncbi:hypothetical protein Ndes2437A_g07918 [Nannochloris sp. 'desiccata']|nr:hypothetical protein KSW81_005824 [Chlorella desiccata (nom. nud.)]
MKILAIFVILFSITSQIRAYNVQKCSACEAVAAELSTRLANERPRNHLDARHRLDAEGKRYGKVIDFKISELRVIELIEDLCTEMNKYQLASHDNSSSNKERSKDSDDEKQRWILSSEALVDDIADGTNAESTEASEHLLKEQRRILRISCSDIIGDWEDDIAEAITSGKADSENVRDVLCVALGKYCPAPTEAGAGASHRPADEL